jgi:hypothetical protein
MGAVAVAVQIFSGRKTTGQAQRERVRIGLENALHAGRKRIPRVATVSQRGFDLGDGSGTQQDLQQAVESIAWA